MKQVGIVCNDIVGIFNPCVASVGAVLVNGTNINVVTLMVKDCVAKRPSLSVTFNTTECGLTCAFVGVPVRVAVPSPLSLNVSQPGW